MSLARNLFLVVVLVCALSLEASHKKDKPFIQDGVPAELGQFPFAVYVQIFKGSSEFSCTGFIIGEKWVITASHCTDGADSLNIFAGTVDLTKSKGTKVAVTRFYQHPSFDFPNNDISLLELKTELTFDDNIQPVVRASQVGLEITTGMEVLMLGYGLDRNDDDSTPDRLEYTTNLSETMACTQSITHLADNCGLICTVSPTTQTVCPGDSGSSLIYQDPVYGNVALGTLSGGDACDGTAGIFNYYTNLSEYETFIECILSGNTADNCDCRCSGECSATIISASTSVHLSTTVAVTTITATPTDSTTVTTTDMTTPATTTMTTTMTTIMSTTMTTTMTTTTATTAAEVTSPVRDCTKTKKFQKICEKAGGTFACAQNGVKSQVTCSTTASEFDSFDVHVRLPCDGTRIRVERHKSWCEDLGATSVSCASGLLTCISA